MHKAQSGDQVQVRYVIRSQDGSQASSRRRGQLWLTIGQAHPRLPGLGAALVGLAPGMVATLTVPVEQAFGPVDPTRVRSWGRQRFPSDAELQPGKQVRYTNERGQQRLVRIVEVSKTKVRVDTNHRWAGQALELKVKLIQIEPRKDEAGEA